MTARSQYHEHKAQAFESFIRFTEAREFPQWPLEMFLEASNICDLKCAMCPTFSALNPHRFENLRSADRGVLDVDEAMSSLGELLKYAPVVHAHGYGEPTIHPQFKEMIDALAEYEVMVDFFTNGMHLTPELCDFLVERRVARITVSFSGASAEEYENVYIGGKFDQVLEGIANLNAAKEKHNSKFPRIEVNSIGFAHHVEKLPDFVRMMGERGVNVIHLKPLSVYGYIPELHPHRSNMRENIEGELIANAKAIAEQYNVHLASVPFENQPEQKAGEEEEQVVAITDLKNIAKNVDMSKDVRDKLPAYYNPKDDAEVKLDGVACMEPYKTLYTKYGGDVFPCCFKGTQRGMASVNESSSLDVWQADGFVHMRERALEGGYGRKMCGGCIKKSTYPKHHHVHAMIAQYADWYEASFGSKFNPAIVSAAKSLPDNDTIMATWEHGPDSALKAGMKRFQTRLRQGEGVSPARVVRVGKRVVGKVIGAISSGRG